jgi:molecular chaperone DnaJ
MFISAKERELLEELASLSDKNISRSRTQPASKQLFAICR